MDTQLDGWRIGNKPRIDFAQDACSGTVCAMKTSAMQTKREQRQRSTQVRYYYCTVHAPSGQQSSERVHAAGVGSPWASRELY
jgi:hypothetical protein